jgi:tetratricopeptide (TPR) repeat protein
MRIPTVVLSVVCVGLSSIAHADDAVDLDFALNEGWALQERDDYPGAAQAYERALELALPVLGQEHLRTAAILNVLANLYRKMGEYAKAEPLYQRSLKIRETSRSSDRSWRSFTRFSKPTRRPRPNNATPPNASSNDSAASTAIAAVGLSSRKKSSGGSNGRRKCSCRWRTRRAKLRWISARQRSFIVARSER